MDAGRNGSVSQPELQAELSAGILGADQNGQLSEEEWGKLSTRSAH